MCGIAGVVRRAGPLPDLERLQHAIAHRGPDDRGLWRSADGLAGFAHTRLSILDLTTAGHQPMTLADGRLTAVFNGEIYNFKELRRLLMAQGVTFRSNSDTEVILRLYERDGPASVEQLRGMFALAIWDEQHRTCFLARDRFGIKPLFYHATPERLVFGSELRTVLASGLVTAAVDPDAAFEYFQLGSVPEPLTLIKGVRSLEAGQYLCWSNGEARATRYWEIAFPPPADGVDAPAVTRAALLDSIAHHFVSDVPVGVFLSGGLDSSAVTALARVVRPTEELQTFSVTFPGLGSDEGPIARRTAAHFGTVHHELPLDAVSARELFDGFLAAADQPSIDGFNTFVVSSLARANGIKVVLSGLGGDELFGGYPSFRQVPRLARWGAAARAAGPAGRLAVRLAARIADPRLSRLDDLLRVPVDLDAAYRAFRSIFSHPAAAALTRHYLGPDAAPHISRVAAGSERTPGDTVSRLELTRYMRNQLLRDADVMSMAWGVELRVPFLDAAVFDAISRIPARQRLAAGKALLIDAVPEIPAWVVQQPKRGFLFPFEQWRAGAWSDVFSSPSDRLPVALSSWYQRWSVMAFERWLATLRPMAASASGPVADDHQARNLG